MARALYKIDQTDTPEQIKNKIYFAGDIEIDGTLFSYEIFLLPIIGKKPKEINAIHKYLIKKIGTRLKDGKSCLDITEKVVTDGIKSKNYSAFGFIKNLTDENEWLDEASGTMQYFDWCKNGDGPQVWVNDLCRITEPISGSISKKKPGISPLKALLTIFEEVAHKSLGSSLTHLYLLVADHEPERSILPGIYNKYGFSVVDINNCEFANHIVMRKMMHVNVKSKTDSQQLVSSVQDISSSIQEASPSRTSIISSTPPLETIHYSLLEELDYRRKPIFHSIFETPELLSSASSRQFLTSDNAVGQGVIIKKNKEKKNKHKLLKKNKTLKNKTFKKKLKSKKLKSKKQKSKK